MKLMNKKRALGIITFFLFLSHLIFANKISYENLIFLLSDFLQHSLFSAFFFGVKMNEQFRLENTLNFWLTILT